MHALARREISSGGLFVFLGPAASLGSVWGIHTQCDRKAVYTGVGWVALSRDSRKRLLEKALGELLE